MDAEFHMSRKGNCVLTVNGKFYRAYVGEEEARLGVAMLLNEPLERVVAYYVHGSCPLRGEFVLEDVED